MVVWVATCCYVLYSYWTHHSAWLDAEVSTIYFLKMTLLTFPLGAIVVTIGEVLVTGLGLDFAENISQQAVTAFGWLVMTITGFFQWFVLVPKIWSWFLTKKSSTVDIRRE